MIMMHRFMLPPDEWATFEALSVEGWNSAKWDEDKMLLFPFLLTVSVVKRTWKAFSEENLRQFDPIVRENSCHIRAGALLQIFRNPRVKGQLQLLAQQADEVDARMRECLRRPKAFLKSQGGLHLQDVVLLEDGEAPAVSLFLVQAHFLTLGKVFSINTQGKEVSQLPLSRVRSLLKLPREIPEDLIGRVVLRAQSVLSRMTIDFIRREAALLFDETALLPRRMLEASKIVDISGQTGHPQSLRSSCSLFNFQVVLQRLKREKTVVLVKENEAALGGVVRRCEAQFFRSVDGLSEFSPVAADRVDPKEKVFIFEGFLPGGAVGLRAQVARVGGLSEAVLINVAHLPQFGVAGLDHLVADVEAEVEISRRRDLARALGCSLALEEGAERRFFTISHTFAAVVGGVEM